MDIAYYIAKGVGFDYSGIWKVEVLETKFVGPHAPRPKQGLVARVRKIELVWWADDRRKPTRHPKEPDIFNIRASDLARNPQELLDMFDKMKKAHMAETAQSLATMASNHSFHVAKLAVYSRGMISAKKQIDKLNTTELDCSVLEW